MQIATARQKADNHLATHTILPIARRPDPEARVMTRFPTKGGNLITAPDTETLREKVAKRIQAHARRQGR